ncbi:Serine acetyltransferase [Tumidithrix helvetica PCC 7403]|uniref:acyltransferase n=1 Tax=Tumidithrix helvetica TaxID=3457545 RepID=UPI003C95EB93
MSKLCYRWHKLQSKWRTFCLRSAGVEIGAACAIAEGVTVRRDSLPYKLGQVRIGAGVELSRGVILDCWGGNITLDDRVFLGPYAIVYGHGDVSIGKNSLIAMHCRILSSNHTIPERHVGIRSQPDILLPVTIGEDVWLGAGVTILGGITVADGCVVGAGAVVTKNLPPYSVAVGVPAQVVRERP